MSKTSTTKIIDIADIRDGVIILKNKSLRSILSVSSINLDLKSKDEQKAVILAYQNFLNSLDFQIQITAQSRELDIEKYLKIIQEKEQTQENELLRIQTSEYQSFIKGLIEMTNIMKKNFYIIVPFSPVEAKREHFLQKMQNVFKSAKKQSSFTKQDFERYKEQLWQRSEYIADGLAGLGLRVEPLDTQNILELFYRLYNPE